MLRRYRSSHSEVEVDLKLIKLKLIKVVKLKLFLIKVFSCEFHKISKNAIFTEYLWTTASISNSAVCERTLVQYFLCQKSRTVCIKVRLIKVRCTKPVRKHCKLPKYYDQHRPKNFFSNFMSLKNE